MPAAVVVAAVVAAGATVYAANKSSSAAKSAANTQATAADKATQAQLEMYYQTRKDQAPWVAAGKYALNALVGTQGAGGKTTTTNEAGGYWSEPKYEQQITGYKTVLNWDGVPTQEPIYGNVLTEPPKWIPSKSSQQTTAGTPGTTGLIQAGPGEFKPEEEPGYKFGYEEFIEKPSLRLASATGKLGSGATLKALTRYASDYASTKYDNFLDRYYKSLDPYFRMAGLGSNVAIAGGNQATATGQGVANTTLAGGAATAAGQLGSAYPYTQLANTVANNALNYGMNYKSPTTQNMSLDQYWNQSQFTPDQMNTMGWV